MRSPLYRHLLQPLGRRAFLAAIDDDRLALDLRKAVSERPHWLPARPDPVVDGVVLRARHHARLLGEPEDAHFADPRVLREAVARWVPPPGVSPHQRRRRTRLLAHVERGLERLIARQGLVAGAWVRWVDEGRALESPDSLAVCGLALGNRSSALACPNDLVDAMLRATRRPDWELIAAGHAHPDVLRRLDEAAWGRWVGRRARWLAELPRDHHYQWAVVGFVRALATRGAGGLLDDWCPPPSRHWRAAPAWSSLPEPGAFFAGERCTRAMVLDAGDLPPEWEDALREGSRATPSAAFRDAFATTLGSDAALRR
ncbi:MAG: hypothetical protein H6738_12130 [Alphaproteobacteria bacterium]|nr:hypothetical protein [Alphaproteobacteria bacterium]MCB9697520.1 hypothetical protein [Alphaproteobacteria bacterium]